MNAPLHPLPIRAEAAQWLRRDAVAELADLAASLSVSIHEAARREADDLVHMHARQLVLTVRTLAKTIDDMRESGQ